MNAKVTIFSILSILAWQAGSACAQQIGVLMSYEDLLQGEEQKLDKGKAPPDMIKPSPPEQLPFPLNQPNPFENQPQDTGAQGEGESTAGFNPHMMGDFGTFYSHQVITTTSLQTVTTTTTVTTTNYSQGQVTTTTTSTKTVPVAQSRVVLVPVTGLGAFNVGENESPKPTDRIFGFYNFYADIRGPDIGSNVPIVRSSTTSSTTPGPFFSSSTTTVQTTTVTPGVLPRVSLNREVFGFEKTFLDGNASVEFRLPLLQQNGGGFNSYDVGDLTLVGKYAFINDRASGDVLSAGMALTVPSGPGIATTVGTFHSTLFQPWVGYIVNFDRFFIQGIHSVVIPSDCQVPTLCFNDVGLNYWLYRGSPSQFLARSCRSSRRT